MEIEQGPVAVGADEPRWRYVRLSTLFLYLSGRAYIPSIKALQERDPTEGLEILDHIWAMTGFTSAEHDELGHWAYEHCLPDGEKITWNINFTYPGANQKVFLSHYYKALEESRYAWCWFRSKHESAAMWQIYGRRGVAIQTTVAGLSVALSRSGRPWLVSGIKYLDRNQDPAFTVGRGDEKMAPYARRPFLVKGVEYQHELEVRLITVDTNGRAGILLDGLGPGEWIKQIVFWPGFPEREAEALVAAVGKVAPGLAETTKRSRLFERHPHTVLSSEDESGLAEVFEGPCRAAAEKWPAFMQKP